MKNMKTTLYFPRLLSRLLLLSLISTSVSLFTLTARQSMPAHDQIIKTEFDEEDLDLFGPEEIDPSIDNPDTKNFVKRTNFRSQQSSCSPETILEQLIPLGASDLLQEQLYCHTNPLNMRSLLDLPLFLPHVFHYPQDRAVSATLFWNQTNKKNFTEQSTSIDSYLALKNKTLLDILAKIQEIDYINVDLDRVLALFSTTHIQERRLGAALQAVWQSPSYGARLFLPIYYLERNFNIADDELDELSALLGESSEGEQERLKKEHLISDKLGFGDLRIELHSFPLEHDTFALKAGVFATVPTAFSLFKDIKGSSFCTDKPRPTIDLVNLCKNPSVESIRKFLFGALDLLSANLIDTDLGNQRHLGLGFFTQSRASLSSLIKRPWADNFSLHSRCSVEYLFPGYEKRFYTVRPNPDDFTRFDKYKNDQEIDPKIAAEDLAFLEKKLVDWIYPYVFNTRVNPGVVFWLNTKAQYEGDSLGGFLGFDFWLKGKDRIFRLCDPSKSLPINTLYKISPTLEIKKARLPFAYQLKAFGSLMYQIKTPFYNWILSLNADKTFKQVGIGKDFNVTVQFEISF